MSASAIACQVNQNPLSGVTYNAAGQPTVVNLGSGDGDAFTYDANTGRMTQYQYNVNGQSFVGNLTWNANGSLASQQTIDPFNAADTQSCAYTHYDLVRIQSDNCGSAWSQTFGYDPFGNLTKSVPPHPKTLSSNPLLHSQFIHIIVTPLSPLPPLPLPQSPCFSFNWSSNSQPCLPQSSTLR